MKTAEKTPSIEAKEAEAESRGSDSRNDRGGTESDEPINGDVYAKDDKDTGEHYRQWYEALELLE